MNTSHHVAARVAMATGGITAVLAVAEAVNLAARHLGALAGAALTGAVFAACWIASRVWSLLHPVSQRPREPQIPAQAGNAPVESRVPDMLPVL